VFITNSIRGFSSVQYNFNFIMCLYQVCDLTSFCWSKTLVGN